MSIRKHRVSWTVTECPPDRTQTSAALKNDIPDRTYISAAMKTNDENFRTVTECP